MFKLPGHLHSETHYTTEFESEDVNIWTKFFDRSQTLTEDDRNRINHIFNKLVVSIVKYEREQDFQLLEALAKRLLSSDMNKEENITLTGYDQERLVKLRTLCKRSKHYGTIEKLLSTMFTREKSGELILPPINRNSPMVRSSSLSFDDTHITLPAKKRQRISDIQPPTKSNPITMHGPVTLQNIYQALPAAALHFAQDEYVWHANRPVNMILASGVQLPNVLTESVKNTNAESEQFFSKLIEDIIIEYEKRHPSDHYAALKQWKHKNGKDDDSHTQSGPLRRMNGFETLIDVVQRRHLGKLQRYYLNVVSSNLHFNPYDLVTVAENKVDSENHYVFSVFGILNVRQNGLDVEFFELAEWYRHAKLWHACRQIPFFRDYLIRKEFCLWLANARFSRFARRRHEISKKHLLLMNNRVFQMAILEIRRVILEYQRLTLLPKLFQGMLLSLADFETMVKQHTHDTVEYTKKFYNHIKTILDMARDTCAKKLHLILKCLEEDNIALFGNKPTGSIYEQRIRKENLRKELEEMQNDIRNICPFLNVCSAMLASDLCNIQRNALSQFNLTNAAYLTKLHMSDFDSNRMLRYLPSWDDYNEAFQLILQQPQQMLHDQWKQILELDTCLRDADKFGETMRQEGLTNRCEKCGQDLYPVLEETSSNSCACKKQQTKTAKDVNNLSIKGHGFFGSTNRNSVLPFESIFSKDMKYKEEIKAILSQFRLSFDELDAYCESNEWLCEINRYCLQWTPNQMKQMSEGKQVFLIEEQLNLLRGWIDKTRTFELTYSTTNSIYVLHMDCSVISRDLCNKVERIYSDFGKYLHRYACSNAQTLINKCQAALEVFDQRPVGIEDFAKFAAYLAPHKTELSTNQQTVEYFTSLFDIIFMHFGYLRQEDENEMIEKTMVDTWKLFQKKLSDAADFVAQENLIIKQRLRDIFEKYLNEAELLYNQSTSGIFLDPTQEPMNIVKKLKKNCIDFMGLQKQLRQYAEWRALLAANSSNPVDDDQTDQSDMNNVNQWSNEIDLRKDLWKYVEITASSIKEWKNTFVNKFNLRRAQEKIECWIKIAEDFKDKISEDDPIVLHWITMLEQFEQNLDLLKKLLSDAMTVEQWKILFRANGHEYDPKHNYRIQDLIDLNILQIENQEVFTQIHKQATREQKLKDKLAHMQTWLSELHYRMAKYKPLLKATPTRFRLTSSYRQRLTRFRELRSRTPTTNKTQSDAKTTTEVSTEVAEEAYIMINSQEVLRLIEDRLLLLHCNEPFRRSNENRREQFQEYYALFDNAKEMTQLWLETQKKWIFLRSALANLNIPNDDQSHLKQISIKFNEVDEQFRNFQKLAFQNPSVAGLAKVESNRIHFKSWLNEFNELVTQLEFYLNEQYRTKFGRFFFLSNDDLINLISVGLDPRFYIPYVRQLFKGIHHIQYYLPEQTIGTTVTQTMNSATTDVYAYRLEGASISNTSNEKVPLISKLKLTLPTVDAAAISTHLISSQSLTRWFESLEKLMTLSLNKLTFDLINKKLHQQLEEAFFKKQFEDFQYGNAPLQIILLVEHILFGLTVEKQIKNKSKLSIRNLKHKIDEQINCLITQLTYQHNSLIAQRIYFRDVLSKLSDNESNLTMNSYEWLSLIKYEIEQNSFQDHQINLLQFSNRIHYNFEFFDSSSIFIISPMMEKVLFELTQAICSHRIGLIHGPTQNGRSSIVQTLAQLCGTNCIDFICHKSMDTRQIENYHRGLVISNNWCLLKDIHQLSTDCLSSLAIAMRHIRAQFEERQILSNNSFHTLKRSKSQSDINLAAALSSKTHTRAYEYPVKRQIENKLNSIITMDQEIMSYPRTYGLFATFDNHYQPLSSTIKFECRTVSMSQPDLKHIAQSLFYTARLFTIDQKDKCREISENLVHFIEYLQLSFYEMKTFCSSLLLLRSIIEQTTSMNISQSIITILKRYELYDSMIPEIMKKFFLDNQFDLNNDDDQLLFVENLKQEASDDKITFDNNEIFDHASRLMSATKQYDLIFIVGECGSAKSSLIRLVERTVNKQMSTTSADAIEDDKHKLIIINKVFPNAFDEDQFYRTKMSFIELWKRYHTTTIATDISDQYWIVIDIDSNLNWLTAEKIHYLYNDLLSSVPCQNGTIKLIVECDQLPNDFNKHCTMYDKTFLINVNRFSSHTKLIQTSARNLELKLHLPDGTLSSIKDFVNDTIEPYITYLEKEQICYSYINHFTDSFIKILYTFIDQHLIDIQHHYDILNYVFVYCFIWSFVQPIHRKHQQQIVTFVQQLLNKYDFPTNDCKLTDLYPDVNSATARFVHIRQWLKSNEIEYDCISEFESATHLMTMLIANNYSIGIFTYERGFGKTTLMKSLLNNVQHLRFISTNEQIQLLHDDLLKHNLPVITHSKANQTTKFVVWIEDVAKTDIELIRSWTDEYSAAKQHDLNIVITGDSFYSYPKRFSRHFIPIIIDQPISTLIGSIYSIPIRDWLEEFPAESISHPIELAHACLITLEEIFDFLKQYLSQIQWNLHHVDSVVNGMLLLDGKFKRKNRDLNKVNTRFNKKKQQDEQVATIVRLLCHELARIILDRLNNPKDRILFQDFLYKTIVMNFCTELEFHVVPVNDDATVSSESQLPTTAGRKQVKFKLGLVSDRETTATLEGPIVTFAKLIGLPKIKDPSKVTNTDEIIEKLCQSTHFSKQILPMHGDFIGNRDVYTNQYQESNDSEISTALHSCQLRMNTKPTNIDLLFVERTCRHITNLVRIFCLSSNGHALLRTNTIGLGRQDLVQFAAYITRQQFFDAHSYIPTLDEDESVRQCLRSACLLAGLKQKNIVILIRANLVSNQMLQQLYIFTREGTYPGLYSDEEQIRIAASLSPGLPATRRVTKTNAVLKTFYTRTHKRIHLVILETSQYPRHQGLLSSCYIDEYESWTKDEITAITKYWLSNKIDLSSYSSESTSAVDLMCQSLAEIYLTMDYFQLFTLRNLRKTVNMFIKFHQYFQEKEDIRLARYESMLNRANKSERIIGMNKQFCAQLQNEINDIQEKLSKLDEEFKAKKKDFSIAMEDCREEEKLLAEMNIALDRLRQDVQAAVANANPQYENALKALRMLNKSDYDEIRTFRQPPQPVLAVMNTICIMFNRKPEWSEAKILMVNENFFDDLLFYDKNNMTDDVFEMLTQIVQFETFEPSHVAISSKAAASLCGWVLAVYEYAKIARSQRTKVEQLKAYQDLYDKRQHILGEKRLRAEKLKHELTELIGERRSQTNELQSKLKRQNSFQATIDKTRSMLKLIDADIQHWQKQTDQGKSNKKNLITNSILISLYFSYLTQFNVDQRQQFLNDWRTKILEQLLPTSADFNLIDLIINEKEFNDFLLQQETSSMADQNFIINAIVLSNRLDNSFVLFVNNPEEDTSLWNDFLSQLKTINLDRANEEIELYHEYKRNQLIASSSNARMGSYQDRSQIYSRISSSKTYVTEVTEKSSLWETSTALSRGAGSIIHTKSAETVALSDLEKHKHLVSLPEFSLEEFQRPENNIIHLSGKQNEDFEKDLLAAMFFGIIVIIDECDFILLNPFLYRFLHWSLKRDQSTKTFPNLFRFGDQEIFVNSSFRLILNYRHVNRSQWKNNLLHNRFVDMSLGLDKIENDIWLRISELKCQNNFTQQIRANQRNYLTCLNEEYQRRENLIDILETKESLTIESGELLKTLENFNNDRISINNSINEHRVQREILSTRTGCESYKESARNLSKFYILLRNCNIECKISLKWFIQILTSSLPKKFEAKTNENTFDIIGKVQARETYLRCFQSVLSYLSSSMSTDTLQYILILYAFIKQEYNEYIDLLDLIIRKLNPIYQEMIPSFLDDNKRPSFINGHSWLLCSEEIITRKYPKLTENLLQYQEEWKEYLFSSKKFDFINKSPYEKTTQLDIIDRFLLSFIVQPNKIIQSIQTFLIYHYGGLLNDKPISPIDNIYQLTSNETLNPVNNIILIWTSSSNLIDPIEEIKVLANINKQPVRLVSSIDGKRLQRFIKLKKSFWLIITDIHLLTNNLLLIRDFLLTSIDNKIWLITDTSNQTLLPHWLFQRCLQVYLSDSSQSTIQLRLKEKLISNNRYKLSEKQIDEIVHIHSNLVSKKFFANNWTNLTEINFNIDLKHSVELNRLRMIDYRNYLENDDQFIFINYLEQSKNPEELVGKLVEPVESAKAKSLFGNFEYLLRNIILPKKRILKRKEDELLLVESIVRSYLTQLRSTFVSPRFHSMNSSLIDLFILNECHLLEFLEKKLSCQMENLLEIFSGNEFSTLDTDEFTHSILYDTDHSILTFVQNYGLALENLSKTTSNNINLTFIRRRRKFINFLRLQQSRKEDGDLVFHIKSHTRREENPVLCLSGIYSGPESNRKDIIICLEPVSSNCSHRISVLILNTNEIDNACYLPIVNADKNDTSELISLSIDKSHM